MKVKITRCFYFLFVLNKINSQSILTIGTTTVVADTILTGINVPWEI